MGYIKECGDTDQAIMANTDTRPAVKVLVGDVSPAPDGSPDHRRVDAPEVQQVERYRRSSG